MWTGFYILDWSNSKGDSMKCRCPWCSDPDNPEMCDKRCEKRVESCEKCHYGGGKCVAPEKSHKVKNHKSGHPAARR